ncbi:MAG: outer membrane protein assembly factor BamA [candidate division Zixibacteria bacterium]|nr:outer membrane protein assembly factor BamA [candidate division Zixibacteria bacterium]
MKTTVFIFTLCLTVTFLFAPSDAQERRPIVQSDKVIIDEINVSGNSYFDKDRIKSQLTVSEDKWYAIIKRKTLLTDRVIQYQESLVDSLYHVNGFLDAESDISVLKRTQSNWIDLHVDIFEGVQTRINSVRFSGGLDELRKQTKNRLEKLKTGEPYNHMQIAEIAYDVEEIYNNNGYPYCQVKTIAEISADRERADISMNITPGELSTIGDISITGLNLTKGPVVRRELLFDSGDIYNREKVLDSQRRLYSSGLFSYVSINTEKYPETQNPPDIKIKLSERKPNFVNLRSGAGQDEQRDLTLDAFVEYGNRNLFGTGRKFSLLASSSFGMNSSRTQILNFRNRFAASYVEPWLFLVRMPLEVQFSYEPSTQSATQDYVYTKYSTKFALTRELDRHTELILTEDFESIDIHDIPADLQEAFRERQGIRLSRRFTVNLQKDNRDNILIPTTGYLTQMSAQYAGGIQGGDVHFIKISANWNRYQILKGSNVFASRLQINWMRQLDDTEEIPLEDLFFMGGARSIRGYRENSLGPKFSEDDSDSSSLWGTPKGGRFALMANLEIRRPLFWRFGGTFFTDIGNLWDEPEDFGIEALRLTAGAGLQFFTPIGPVRFDYAFRIIRAGDDPGSRYHISILYAF